MRAVLRFAASVLMVSGTLLIADATTTLLWQEPLSAWLAQRSQSRLEKALAKPPRRVQRRQPLPGDALVKIRIPRIGVSRFIVEGTDLADLRRGPGHYRRTRLPGQHGTVAVAGHRTTYGAPFRHIDKLRRGDTVILDMTYGRFLYRVQGSRIVPPTALWVTKRKSYDRLVLTACHPLFSAAKRIVVFARFVRRSRGTTVKRS
jgi:sortase A